IPPEFKSALRDIEVNEGNTVTLRIHVTGSPKPEVDWFKDGKPVSGLPHRRFEVGCVGEVYTLVIKEARGSDTGKYLCKAYNSAGEVTSSCNVDVLHVAPKEPPKFERNLKDITIAEGCSTRFDVQVTGSPEPKVFWYHNGKLVQPRDHVDIVHDDEHSSLILMHCPLDLSGKYTCVAENEVENDAVRLEVEVTGEPKPVVLWFCEGKPIEENRRVYTMRDGSTSVLVIENAELDDEAMYTCKAINDLGEVECSSEMLPTDEAGPKFLQRLELKEVVEGSRTDLEVEVSGKPKPVVEWLKDGELVKPSSLMTLETEGQVHTLTIMNTTLDDEGEYTCIAKNKVGEVSCTAELLVEEGMRPPQFIVKPSSLQIMEGKMAKFEARVSGLPGPEVEWLRDGRPIKPGRRFQIEFEKDRSVLTIIDAKLNDEGEYTCVATSKAGKDSCSVELLVDEAVVPPEFVRKISNIELTEGEIARFDVRITGTPAPEVTWYKDEVPIEDGGRFEIYSDDDKHSLVIRDCALSDTGSYSCKATNEAGQASCYGELTI
ncbi:predicted protein, partial [Nematostella vectensis]